jgi:tellurite resistance protein TerC
VNVPLWVWLASCAVLVAILVLDLVLSERRPHEMRPREAGAWVAGYVALAAIFAVGLGLIAGGQHAGEFVAGYITEYSLSVDNLFVFIVIMSAFAVPRLNQRKVLTVGIMVALILRGAFIIAGAAALARFEWLFYVFGAFLLITAVRLAVQNEEKQEEQSAMVRWAKRLPRSTGYDGTRLFTRVHGRRFATPMLAVMLVIGMTDLLFALDSIPAIFGLTREPYIVFTANAFALLGLRQLFFLIGGLLDRLVYLSKGLAVILGFIGVKLVLEALHGSGVHVPQIPIALSLVVILGILAVTVIASLVHARHVEQRDQEQQRHQEGGIGSEATSAPSD